MPGHEEILQEFRLLLRHHRHLPGEKIPAAVVAFFRFRCLRAERG